MNPVAVYLIAICGVGAVLAGAGFAFAALRGEFTDAAQAAFLVFDDDDARAAAPPAPPAPPGSDPPSSERA